MTTDKPPVQARTQPHAEPTAEDLRRAFRLCKARSWPDDFDAVMADPAKARLVHLCATGLLNRLKTAKAETLPVLHQSPLLRAWPPQRAPTLPVMDRKRAAAGDHDD